MNISETKSEKTTGMILNHKRPAIHTFKFPNEPLIQNGKRVYKDNPKTGKKVLVEVPAESVELFPGINILTHEEYEKVKELTFYIVRVRDNMIEEVCRGDTLGDVPEDKLSYVISECVDVDLLEEWQRKYGEGLTGKQRDMIRMKLLQITDPKRFAEEEQKQKAKDNMRSSKNKKKRSYQTVSELKQTDKAPTEVEV